MIVECPACSSRYDVGSRPVGTQLRCRCGAAFAAKAPSESVATLRCPRCGGPCSPESASCEYCKAVLAAAACPHCFGRVFQGSPHCPHCGAAIQAPAVATGQVTPRACPRCAPAAVCLLVAHVVDGTLLDECPACGGVWIDTAAFTKLIADRERQAAVLQSDPPPLPIDGAESDLRYLRCPNCSVLMNRQNFGQRSGVIVDVCKPHGTWFDRDELRRIIQFVMNGGLEETKRRQLDELNRALQNKREAVSEAALEPAMSNGSVANWGTHKSGLLSRLLDALR